MKVSASNFFGNLVKASERFFVIHYSSQSLYDADSQGLSPRITSIAVMHFATRQTTSFSVHGRSSPGAHPGLRAIRHRSWAKTQRLTGAIAAAVGESVSYADVILDTRFCQDQGVLRRGSTRSKNVRFLPLIAAHQPVRYRPSPAIRSYNADSLWTKVFWFFFSKKNRLPFSSPTHRKPHAHEVRLTARRHQIGWPGFCGIKAGEVTWKPEIRHAPFSLTRPTLTAASPA
jgi:hypothetical protein